MQTLVTNNVEGELAKAINNRRFIPYLQMQEIFLGHDETRMIEKADEKRVVGYVLESLQSWTVYHFHDTSENAGVRDACDLHDNRTLRADASNLPAFLYLLKEKHPFEYQEIVGAIRLVAPFFDGFVLEPDGVEENAIRLQWKHASEDAYFDANALSDGTLRFICLATLLLQPQLPPTVLLDEPELGLHPAAITLLGEMIRAASERAQLIISTQSVTFVNQFLPEDIVVVEREDEASSFRRIDDEDWHHWLEDYGVGDIGEKNLFGGRPGFRKLGCHKNGYKLNAKAHEVRN